MSTSPNQESVLGSFLKQTVDYIQPVAKLYFDYDIAKENAETEQLKARSNAGQNVQTVVGVSDTPEKDNQKSEPAQAGMMIFGKEVSTTQLVAGGLGILALIAVAAVAMKD